MEVPAEVVSKNAPAAEIAIDEAFVAKLVSNQQPDLAGLTIKMLAHGWDNALFRLGEDLVVRMPRRLLSSRLVENEVKWLPVIGPRLSLPVPIPLRIGQPSDDFPWSWTILPWFEGAPMADSLLTGLDPVARQLGKFLAELHQPAPSDAPINPYRGVPLSERAEITISHIGLVSNEIEALGISPASVRQAWSEAVSLPVWEGEPTWLHGDLHPLNILQLDGEVSAVIDFGDITSGDPATDLMVAWYLFDESQRDTFRLAAESAIRPIDNPMWGRARGWAIAHSVAMLAGAADSPALRRVAEQGLMSLFAD